MEVEDGVDTILGADINDAVEVLEAGLFENPWVHVVFEVVVVEGDTDAVQFKALEKRRVFLLEEIFEELSNKKSDFPLPIVSARASRIWCSQPG